MALFRRSRAHPTRPSSAAPPSPLKRACKILRKSVLKLRHCATPSLAGGHARSTIDSDTSLVTLTPASPALDKPPPYHIAVLGTDELVMSDPSPTYNLLPPEFLWLESLSTHNAGRAASARRDIISSTSTDPRVAHLASVPIPTFFLSPEARTSSPSGSPVMRHPIARSSVYLVKHQVLLMWFRANAERFPTHAASMAAHQHGSDLIDEEELSEHMADATVARNTLEKRARARRRREMQPARIRALLEARLADVIAEHSAAAALGLPPPDAPFAWPEPHVTYVDCSRGRPSRQRRDA